MTDDTDAEYEDDLEDALDGVRTEPMAGGIAIDLLTRQPLLVRQQVADTLAEYHREEGFDLATYKQHPWLPVRADDAVYECYYINELTLDGLDDWGSTRDYDFPRGRLAHVPVEMAWTGAEVGDI